MYFGETRIDCELGALRGIESGVYLVEVRSGCVFE